ncbi:MAG: thiamine phosphate synthase [Deltaproteobacteria bacterium]|nr:thiamine phosphate synthase [Deltaproteobacteria bacterium]
MPLNPKEAAFGLYLITDRHIAARSGTLLAAVEKALEGGVRFVQLREKDLGGRELLRLARGLREMTSAFGARLMINDRADIAVLSDADGVHLGQKSVSALDARILLGEGKLIGVSTHSLEEALAAEAEGADYITLGPVFHTPSKAAWGDPVGVGLLQKAVEKVSIPVYAIGGIREERLGGVLSAGAAGVAVISAILGQDDVKESAGRLLAALNRLRKNATC